jgi:hypothetical protein
MFPLVAWYMNDGKLPPAQLQHHDGWHVAYTQVPYILLLPLTIHYVTLSYTTMQCWHLPERNAHNHDQGQVGARGGSSIEPLVEGEVRL